MQETMAMNVLAAGEGWAEVVGHPRQEFNNPMGRTHGGYAATLIDTALGCAVMSVQSKGVRFGTVELEGELRGENRPRDWPRHLPRHTLHAGRTMLTAEAKVVDGAGKLLAHGSGTFLVFPKQ
ncbi:MAG: PaaI family thioesterase [Hyphomicrobiales bacterium]